MHTHDLQDLLYTWFIELGRKDLALGVLETDNKFLLYIYKKIFEKEIARTGLIISEARAQQIRKQYESITIDKT